MDNNWIIDNLNYAFGVWNDKLTEMWSLLTQSPQAFKGGTIWQTIQTVNGAMQGIGYGLLVLFLAIGIFRSSASFRDFQRPEHVLRHFIYFVMAKLAVTYGIDLMVDIFAVCAGIISAAAGSVGGIDGAAVSLPAEIAAAIEDVGFLASIPLWLVTLLGCLLAARVKKDWLVPVPIVLPSGPGRRIPASRKSSNRNSISSTSTITGKVTILRADAIAYRSFVGRISL